MTFMIVMFRRDFRARASAEREHLMGVFSIFPDRASTTAGEVDALYTFLLVVGVGMTALIFFLSSSLLSNIAARVPMIRRRKPSMARFRSKLLGA